MTTVTEVKYEFHTFRGNVRSGVTVIEGEILSLTFGSRAFLCGPWAKKTRQPFTGSEG